MEILEIVGIPYFKNGSGIHIKKENRGKFTEYCDGKVTQECIDRAKKSNNPTLRKRATFAENARAWKHQNGGILINNVSMQTNKYLMGGVIPNPYIPKGIPFVKLGTKLTPKYFNGNPFKYVRHKIKYSDAPTYQADNLKGAIFQAYDDGLEGQDIWWNGNVYKAKLNAQDTNDYYQYQRDNHNKSITDEQVVNNYVNFVLWKMENPENKGRVIDPDKSEWYTSYDDGTIKHNLGPGIAITSDMGATLDYNKRYSKEELNNVARVGLLKLMNQISNQLNSKYGDAYKTMSLGDRLVLLDIAYNVRPRSGAKNMPVTGWPALTQALINRDYETAKANTYSGSSRRQQMRNQLLGLYSIGDGSLYNV